MCRSILPSTDVDTRTMTKELALRITLSLAGAFIVFTGVNIGLGGMATLGLMGSRDFFAVTDGAAFHVQDSHVRFLGGLWLGVGLIFLASAMRLQALKPTLLVCCTLVFVGGLARFSAMQFDVLFGPRLIGSLAAELLGMPALYIWILATKPHAK